MKSGMIIIVNACIWGLVMITAAIALKETGEFEKIQHILTIGAGASMLVVFLGVRRLSKK